MQISGKPGEADDPAHAAREQSLLGKHLRALPPYPLQPAPDFESYDPVKIIANLGHSVDELNRHQFIINGEPFRAEGRSLLGAFKQIVEKISNAGWWLTDDEISSYSERIIQGKSSRVTKLFQAGSAPAATLAGAALRECDVYLEPAMKPPHYYILSSNRFLVLHKKKLRLGEDKSAPKANAYIANIFEKGLWRSELYITDLPEEYKKKFTALTNLREAVLSPNPKSYLIKPKVNTSLSRLQNACQSFLPPELLEMEFHSEDKFYVVVKSLMAGEQLAQFEALDHKENHLALSEYTLSIKAGNILAVHNVKKRQQALAFLKATLQDTLQTFPLLNQIERTLTPIQTSTETFETFKLKNGRFTVVRTCPYAFTLDQREIFSATLSTSLTYRHNRFYLMHFITHIRHPDAKAFKQHALPIFEDYEKSLVSHLIT